MHAFDDTQIIFQSVVMPAFETRHSEEDGSQARQAGRSSSASAEPGCDTRVDAAHGWYLRNMARGLRGIDVIAGL